MEISRRGFLIGSVAAGLEFAFDVNRNQANAAERKPQSAQDRSNELYLPQVAVGENEDGEVSDGFIRQEIAKHYGRLSRISPEAIQLDESLDLLENKREVLQALAKQYELVADAWDTVKEAHPYIPNVFLPYINSFRITILEEDDFAAGNASVSENYDGSYDITIRLKPEVHGDVSAHEAMHTLFETRPLNNSPLFTMHRRVFNEAAAIHGALAYAFLSDTGDIHTRNPYNTLLAYDEINAINSTYGRQIDPIQVNGQQYTHKQAISSIYEEVKDDPDLEEDYSFGKYLPYTYASEIVIESSLIPLEGDETNLDYLLPSLIMYYAKLGHNYDPGQSPIPNLFEHGVQKAIENGHIHDPAVSVADNIPYQIVSAPDYERHATVNTEDGIKGGQVLRHFGLCVLESGLAYEFLYDLSKYGLLNNTAVDSKGNEYRDLVYSKIIMSDGINTSRFQPVFIENPNIGSISMIYRFDSNPYLGRQPIAQRCESQSQGLYRPVVLASVLTSQDRTASLISQITGKTVEQVQKEVNGHTPMPIEYYLQ